MLFVWNDFLVGFTLAQDNAPIAAALAGQLRQFGVEPDVIAPAAFFSAMIPLTVFALFQRYFVAGPARRLGQVMDWRRARSR